MQGHGPSGLGAEPGGDPPGADGLVPVVVDGQVGPWAAVGRSHQVADVVQECGRYEVIGCTVGPGQVGALQRMGTLVDDLPVVLGTPGVQQCDHLVDGVVDRPLGDDAHGADPTGVGRLRSDSAGQRPSSSGTIRFGGGRGSTTKEKFARDLLT